MTTEQAPLDPLAKRVNAMLTDARVPEPAREVLRGYIQRAYAAWVDRYRTRPPTEP